MTYIYGIFIDNLCYYIGQSKDTDKRFKQHKRDILSGKHTVKSLNKALNMELNKVNIDDIEFRVIAEIKSDNSFLVCLIEGLYNSIYKPKNKIIWRSGYNIISFARVNDELAYSLINCLKVGGVIA